MADNFNTIKCPACQKEMKKIFIPREGINIDVCVDGCGGIYFDNREFKYFDEQAENIDELSKAIEGKTFIPVNQDLPRTCPACGSRMVKNHSSAKKMVQVDECYSCGGKFLDHGELDKIRAEYETEEDRSRDAVACLYASVGQDLKKMELDRAMAQRRRSPIKKLFDNLIGF